MIDWIWLFFILGMWLVNVMLNCFIPPDISYSYFDQSLCYWNSQPNYHKKWRRDMELTLSLMALDMCLFEEKLVVSDDDRSFGTKAKLGKWERSNRLYLMIIKGSMIIWCCANLWKSQGVSWCHKANKELGKVEIRNLFNIFTNARCGNVGVF